MIADVENAMNNFSKIFTAPLSYMDVSISIPPSIGGNLQEIVDFGKIKLKPHLVFLSRLYKSALESNHTMDKFVRLLK